MAQRQWQGVLAAVPGEEDARLTFRQLPELADRVTLEGLDLDDVCPALGEQLGTKWNRDELAELDHANA